MDFLKPESVLDLQNIRDALVHWALVNMEKIHSQIRRYESPDEVPFFPKEILEPLLPSINYPKILTSYSDEVNINDEIKQVYIEHIVPLVSAGEGEQQENLGSCTTCDIDNLQALSRRIHFGKFVAEAKFQNERAKYTKLIQDKDIKGIEDAITNSAVEAKILERLIEKTKAYGTDPTLKWSQNQQNKLDPEYLAKIYKDWVIPLTKKVEVDYLLRRLEEE
ncbi:Chorismate mutase [Wickerhamomyces ciferrii]|uniref:Chorismate mutase n=1 Tax=Wickerhamomyces ciferrii (strain ATCC 14091 / BCRC 22168 / CBS 111 / JCM 3599 / NBRC 0793 / NRRL Y-1031 F-60-10) TaxID=1206466 RepID=K0KRZ1_WICCF|nr:Chorismate mutase [Wickerhamomyces ciferrii]CCH44113.1 Chorismate mutase [Wickerhamomyces ciferrii]